MTIKYVLSMQLTNKKHKIICSNKKTTNIYIGILYIYKQKLRDDVEKDVEVVIINLIIIVNIIKTKKNTGSLNIIEIIVFKARKKTEKKKL